MSARALYEALSEIAEDLVFLVDRDGRYLMFARRGLEECGFSQEGVIGKRPLEAFPEEMGRRFQHNNEQVLLSGKPVLMQEWLSIRGASRCFSTSLTPVRDASGGVAAVLGITRDITEEKLAQNNKQIAAQRREVPLFGMLFHEKLLRALIRETLPRRTVGEFLQATVRLLGEGIDVSRVYFYEYDRFNQQVNATHEWMAAGIHSIKERMQRIPVSSQPWWGEQMFSGRPVAIEDSAQVPSPELKTLLTELGIRALVAVPIFTFGQPFGFIGFDDCESARKWNDADIELLEGVARIIADRIERQRLEEEICRRERLSAIGRLTARLAHEINNPMQAILLHLDQLDGFVKAGGKRTFQFVRDGFKRVSQIIANVTDVSRELKKQEVDIGRALKNAYAMLSYQVDLKSINVSWQLEANLPVISGDEQKMQQVFFHLMQNAVESMTAGGDLRVTSSHDLCHVTIEIEDNGIGIEEERMPYIFEPFYSSEERSRRGMGLFVSHAIVAEHAGRIQLQSRMGSGTTVIVRLPISDACSHVKL